MPDAAD
jgi:hypothetical protein